MADNLRLTSHPAFPIEQKNRVTLFVDGVHISAVEGESLAAALWANGILSFRHDEGNDTGRGLYCGAGHCYECRVTLDGSQDVRSCQINVREGMRISLSKEKVKKGEHRGP